MTGNESLCLEQDHDFRDRASRRPDGGYVEDGSYGWRACACGRSIPEHADAPPDPAGGEGCGMVWRLCARCDHIEERHVTDNTPAEDAAAECAGVAVPDGEARRAGVAS